jgi:hypothetical protein
MIGFKNTKEIFVPQPSQTSDIEAQRAQRGGEFGDQLHTFSCLSVLHNAVVAWNMVHIEPLLEQLRAEGQRCDDELLPLATPLLRRHITLLATTTLTWRENAPILNGGFRLDVVSTPPL